MLINTLTPATILIVDDHATNLRVLLDSLRESGWKTLVATNGEGALRQIEFASPDIILLDVMMPGIDGFETCRRLKQHPLAKDVPVIFMTALSELVDKLKGFDAGGVDYITKPFDCTELLARIRAHLDVRRYQEQLELANQALRAANHKLLEYQKQLEIAARTDPLTSLSNRREILERIDEEISRSQRNGSPFSLVLGDIDHFKMVNDQFGHDCGDFVLVQVANILRDTLRKHDRVSRWGGEEFLLLLPDTEHECAADIAERARSGIAGQSYQYGQHDFSVTMTFGVSVWAAEITHFELYLKQADCALYQGKEQGRNRVVIFRPT